MLDAALLFAAVTVSGCRGATVLPLDGPGWTLSNSNGSLAAEAVTVPGSIPLSLFAAGVWPDPYVGFNQGGVNWTMSLETNWTYSTTFAFPGVGARATTELVAKQLATVAICSINGVFVGASVDSLLEQRWKVPHALLKPQGNILLVHIGSSYLYAVAKAEEAGVQCGGFLPGKDCMTTYVRQQPDDLKLRDNAPAFPNAGILDSIFLRTSSTPFITAMVPQVFAADGAGAADGAFQVNVRLFLTLPTAVPEGGFEVEVVGDWPGAVAERLVVCPRGCTVAVQELEAAVALTAQVAPKHRWWPNGMGAPQLYNLTASIVSRAGDDDAASDPSSTTVGMGPTGLVLSRRVGFRTVEFVGSVHGSPPMPAEGEPPLFFRINGIRIFAKGANYLHARALSFATQPEERQHTLFLLDSAKQANLNFVRVWGGNGYQYDYFYDRCDELGLLLWHDAPFTGTPQPTDGPFLELVKRETRFQARRLVGHAAIALLSSNNEQSWSADPELFIGAVMKTFQREAGNASLALWPSSPSNGWVSLDPMVARACSSTKVPGGHNNCTGIGHDLHFYMPKLKICRAMAKTVPHSHDKRVEGFADTDINFVGENGWGPSFPLLDSWEAVSPPALDQLHLNSSLVRFRNVVRWTEEQDVVMREVFPHVPAFDNWDCAGTQGVVGTQGCTSVSPPDGRSSSSESLAPRRRSSADLARYSFLTQAVQSRCVSWQREEHRRRPLNAGSLYWSLNSIWTAPTWGHIESGGRYKMAYHSVARVDASFAVYATVTPNAELWRHTHSGSKYAEQTWLRIDAHNDGLVPLLAECTLLLLKDDGTMDSTTALPSVKIGAGTQATLANLSNACPSEAGCLGVIECNATRPDARSAAPRAVLSTARHDLYPNSLQHLAVPSHYTISDVSSVFDAEARPGGCSMMLTSDTLSLLTYVASTTVGEAVAKGRGNFVANGFLLRPGVAQRLEFRSSDNDEVGCSDLVESLLIYSINNPTAVKPDARAFKLDAEHNSSGPGANP